MNQERLQKIFDNYIKKFEFINSPESDENYKWRIAAKFHDLIDPNASDFAERIKEAWKASSNLIDSSNRYCFSALVSCSEQEPESVRQLFKALFVEDFDDLAVRQQKIQTFIENANALTERLHSSNGMFMNDQRSAMAYLFLYDPDRHYLYKASEAGSFASCVEFFDDWGPGTDFRLDVYYRMCDQIVDAIRQCPELVETHQSRYIDKNGSRINGMHPDKNYHILVLDIIYGAPEFRYNFYEGIPFSHITSQSRKLHQERVEKAKELYDVMIEAQAQAAQLKEAKEYFNSFITAGLLVRHKVFGEGIIEQVDGTGITVAFPSKGERKKFIAASAFTGGFLTADIPNLQEKAVEYKTVIGNESSIERRLKSATEAFSKYQEFLE